MWSSHVVNTPHKVLQTLLVAATYMILALLLVGSDRTTSNPDVLRLQCGSTPTTCCVYCDVLHCSQYYI